MVAYGWIQNPGKFENLQHVVQIFDSNSNQYKLLKDNLVPSLVCFSSDRSELLNKLTKGIDTFTYSELVGGSKGKDGSSVSSSGVGRSGAVADKQINAREYKGYSYSALLSLDSDDFFNGQDHRQVSYKGYEISYN